jgi:hypothetical protein
MSLPDAEMARVNIPQNLPELVKAAFNKARSNGDLSFYPTQVTLLNINSIPVGPALSYASKHFIDDPRSFNSASHLP